MLLPIDTAPGDPRALLERYKEMNVVLLLLLLFLEMESHSVTQAGVH